MTFWPSVFLAISKISREFVESGLSKTVFLLTHMWCFLATAPQGQHAVCFRDVSKTKVPQILQKAHFSIPLFQGENASGHANKRENFLCPLNPKFQENSKNGSKKFDSVLLCPKDKTCLKNTEGLHFSASILVFSKDNRETFPCCVCMF